MEAQGPLAGITRQLARYPLGSYANSSFAVLNSVNHTQTASTRPQTANRRQLGRKGQGLGGYEKKNPAGGSRVHGTARRRGSSATHPLGRLLFHFLQRLGHPPQGTAAGTIEGTFADIQPAHDLAVGIAYHVGCV